MAYDTSLYVYGNELIMISLVLPAVILVFLSIFGIYVETDLQGVYFLTFNQRAYYEQRVISWDSNDDIHNYIMNGSEN